MRYDRTEPMRILVNQVFEHIAKAETRDPATGVPTDYSAFDGYTGGLHPSDLIIVAGESFMGKTAFAMDVAMRAACNYDVPTAIFSLAMSKQQLVMRMLCAWGRAWGKLELAKVQQHCGLDDHDWGRLVEAVTALSPAPIFVDDTVALTAMELCARCSSLKAEHGLGLVVVDSLQLMREAHRMGSREQEISDISSTLKAMAEELAIPVVVLFQLDRKMKKRGDKRPVMNDLPDAIAQDADVILFLHREAAYKKEDELTPEDNVAEITIAKQRNGPTGTVELIFLEESASFVDPIEYNKFPEPPDGL